MLNQNKNFSMDNQRNLFKKFFSGSKNDNSHTQINQNGGFNPPKFQFNKKKLGLGLINNGDSEDKKMVKELESVEIESEVILNEYTDYTEDNESIAHTAAGSVTGTTAESDSVMSSVMNTATWNTLPTRNTMKTTNKSDINRISSTSYDENRRSDYDHYKISKNHNNVSSLYLNTLEKNRQKYNLSNQLESFSMQLGVCQKEIEEKRNILDLLLLSFEEKLGKHLDVINISNFFVVQVNNFNLDILL